MNSGVMISIVDDDPSVREATKELLRSLGYSTSTFASADEFLGSEQLTQTACLISDIQMPGLSGAELQRRLLADGHKMPIIFITAFPDERTRNRVLGAGAICYLSKPYSEESLIACLSAALGPER
jgi:FixJ family two-component response regulator